MKDSKTKGVAALIVGKMGKGPEAEGEDTEDTGEEDGLTAAAEEIMSAVKEGDASALKEALKSFYSMC